uniref:Large ribosomal subunit protein uL22m n=1 Tax=Poecilia mexicana TaxID=48701 RepID=A0A3B3WI57_9TELE
MAVAMSGLGVAFIRNIVGSLHLRLQVLGGASQQLSCLHTSISLDAKHWERNNRKVYPPQLPEEPRRPAEVYHSRRQIKYSKDKMWYLAKMVRGMSIDEAIAQLEFNDKKGAKIMREVLLEAQEMAVKNHNVEYKSNLYVGEYLQPSVLHCAFRTQHCPLSVPRGTLSLILCILSAHLWPIKKVMANATQIRFFCPYATHIPLFYAV